MMGGGRQYSTGEIDADVSEMANLIKFCCLHSIRSNYFHSLANYSTVHINKFTKIFGVRGIKF